MKYAEIKYCDIANGSGVRTSLFVSGCTHHCNGCFNQIAWDFNYGNLFTEEIMNKILNSCEPSYVTGLTLLGGEPFEPENQTELLRLIREFKKRYPNKTVWCFSGYTYEQIIGDSRAKTDISDEMLSYIDILVDGKFEKEKHDITLRFRGSSNQRIIDLNSTRKENKVILWQDDPNFVTHTM